MLKDEEFCCNAIKVRIKNKSDIDYDEPTRCYSIIKKNELFDVIFYCPWCGKKLPERLDPWDTILVEYGEDYVKYPGDEGYKELSPEQMAEFKTDEWWRKRGL